MQQHTFYIDKKITMWVRVTHLVEAETKEQAKQIIIDNMNNGNIDDTYDQQEFLYETAEDDESIKMELHDEDMGLIC